MRRNGGSDPCRRAGARENYKNAPKEKLLEFLKGHPAIESLRNFSQSELAIFISEQWALSAESKQTKGAA